MRSQGRLLLRLESIERQLTDAGIAPATEMIPEEVGQVPGTLAPAFQAETTDGLAVSLNDLLAPGLPVFLVFMSSTCQQCRTLVPKVARWQRAHVDQLTIATVSGGGLEAIVLEAEEYGLDCVLADRDLAISEAYHVSGTPSAVLISADGTIASYVASGRDWIEHLLSHALVNSDNDEEGLPIGAPAPELELRGIAGEPVSLLDPAGRETVVLSGTRLAVIAARCIRTYSRWSATPRRTRLDS